MHPSYVFVSDVHIAPGNAKRLDFFISFLNSIKGKAAHLCILGDLFDYWVGRGHENQPEYRSILAKLKEISNSGTNIILLHGNRDFLLSPKAASLSGARIPGSQLRLQIGRQTVHVCHGDKLCESDRGHVILQKFLRCRLFGMAFVALPLSIRERLARKLRSISKRCTARKSEATTDISVSAVQRIFRKGVDTVICGHIHRDGQRSIPCGQSSRILYHLGDFSESGSYLLCEKGEFKLLHYSR